VATIDVVELWLKGRSPRTLKAYRFDLSDFARFMQIEDPDNPAPALELLIAGGPKVAFQYARDYIADMKRRELSNATIARRLAALRSLVGMACDSGRINWTLRAKMDKADKVVPYRDTRGPGREGWHTMLDHAIARVENDPKSTVAKRDLALILLMHDLGLRRGEAVGMDLKDMDLGGDRIRVVRKGRREEEWLTLGSEQAKEALEAWIAVRGDQPGPLFVTLDRAANERNGEELERLSGDAVLRMVARLGKRAGLSRKVKPHGLRHQAITRALELTGGNITVVQRFSGHADPKTIGRYNDNREDHAGRTSRQLGDDYRPRRRRPAPPT
jgi:integrase/recombinase XerC